MPLNGKLAPTDLVIDPKFCGLAKSVTAAAALLA
jgi:hypothetical protein